MADITLNELRQYWKRVSDWVRGASDDKPVVDLENAPERELGTVSVSGHSITDEHPMPTRAVDRNAVEHVLLDSIAVTDADWHVTHAIDADVLRRYKSVEVYVRSTLNEDVMLQLRRDNLGPSSAHAYYTVVDGQPELIETTIPGGTSFTTLALSALPIWGSMLIDSPVFPAGMRISYEADSAPTSGSLSIVVWGVPN